MDRIEKFDEEMIDLGAVSVETKGSPGALTDTDHTGSTVTSISDD